MSARYSSDEFDTVFFLLKFVLILPLCIIIIIIITRARVQLVFIDGGDGGNIRIIKIRRPSVPLCEIARNSAFILVFLYY